ncbi:MAG: PrpR N-terminal domain-containing protein [Clostridia bacterium]|nr:PrpR N-terminal domain-containing protein [Clostridia bacterium]
MRQIKVLAVAPYAQLSDAIMQAAQNHPNILLKVFVGNLEQSLESYVQYSAWHHDVLISRGGTAAMLREKLNLPVFEMETSSADVLRAIKLAQQTGDRFVVIGFHNIIDNCRMLSQILQLDMEIYEYKKTDELPSLLAMLKKQGITLIVGDVATVNEAKIAGLQSILITSSAASIERTLKKVEDFFVDLRSISASEHLLRNVLDCSERGILITDPDGKVLFSNEAFVQLGLTSAIATFQELMKKFSSGSSYQQRQRTINDSNFIIHINKLDVPEPCFVFFIHRQLKAPAGISCVEYEDPEKIRARTVFSSGSYMESLMPCIHQACKSNHPVLLIGQSGTEKNTIARYIHCNSSASVGPFVLIQAGALTSKEWHMLFDDENSVLYSPSGSIFFEHVHLLPIALQSTVAKALTDLASQNRIRIMASSVIDLAKQTSEGKFSRELYSLLNGYCIHTSALCRRRAEIPALAALYISKYNTELNREIIGLEQEAIQLLTNFSWPMNIDQLKMVMKQLVLNAKGYYITPDEVSNVLQNESKEELIQANINTKQPLKDIEKDIILDVLKQENMNQSSAAKRLGISRSTLWRLIKDS